jgi:aminoglycoside/choline kinase family phosphotransferase
MLASRPMTTLPRSPEEITPEWLEKVLRSPTAEPVEVTEVVVEEVMAGSTTKVFTRQELTGPSAEDLPRTVCIKGVFEGERSPVRVLAAQQEASFFRDLAPELEIPLFETWFADADDEQGIVVFEDLRESDTTFTLVGEAWPADRVASALEVQAAWHAATWALPPDRFDWLASTNQVLAMAGQMLFSPEHWGRHLGDPETVQVPDELSDRERMSGVIQGLFALHAGAVHALSHGDAHIGNTYVDGSGQPGFYDWQTFCLAPPLDDVSYFIGGAMTVADRREHERDLLRHYLDALAGNGAPGFDWDEAWLEYRRNQVHGFFWALLPREWQPTEVSVPMAERYIAAIEDHGSVALVGEGVTA